MNNREKILSKIKSVKALPPAVSKVAYMLQKKETDISELTKAIEYDPGLTSNVLRYANSAGLGGLRAVKTLRDAIVRLGMNRIFQLVMVSAVSPIVQIPIKGYDLSPGKLWEHSISVAVGVGEMSKYLSRTFRVRWSEANAIGQVHLWVGLHLISRPRAVLS